MVYDDVHMLEAYDFHPRNTGGCFWNLSITARDMRNCIDESVAVDADSKILTLTPIGGENNKRYIIERYW